MSRLIWSPSALLDVQRVYAKSAVKAIRQGVKLLEHQPSVGRPVDDLGDEFRDWIIDFGDTATRC